MEQLAFFLLHVDLPVDVDENVKDGSFPVIQWYVPTCEVSCFGLLSVVDECTREELSFDRRAVAGERI